MDHIFEFARENPGLFTIVVLISIYAIFQILYAVFFTLPNRFFRAMTMRVNGYPPPHCDADGESREEKKPTQQLDEEDAD